jgi:hypothetical protein
LLFSFFCLPGHRLNGLALFLDETTDDQSNGACDKFRDDDLEIVSNEAPNSDEDILHRHPRIYHDEIADALNDANAADNGDDDFARIGDASREDDGHHNEDSVFYRTPPPPAADADDDLVSIVNGLALQSVHGDIDSHLAPTFAQRQNSSHHAQSSRATPLSSRQPLTQSMVQQRLPQSQPPYLSIEKEKPTPPNSTSNQAGSMRERKAAFQAVGKEKRRRR